MECLKVQHIRPERHREAISLGLTLGVIISSMPGMYLRAGNDNLEALPLKSLSLSSFCTPISDEVGL